MHFFLSILLTTLFPIITLANDIPNFSNFNFTRNESFVGGVRTTMRGGSQNDSAINLTRRMVEIVNQPNIRLWDDVEDFIKRVRHFLDGPIYEIPGSEHQLTLFEEEILELVDHIESFDNLPTEQKVQLKFAGHFFRVARDSLEIIKKYSAIGTPGRHFAHSVVDLNRRILHLFNNDGTPQIQAEGFMQQFINLVYYLKQLESESFHIMPLKFGNPDLFADQLERAEKSLIELLNSKKIKYGSEI